MIFIIDDDFVMASCIAQAAPTFKAQIFTNALEAMDAIGEGPLPQLIFLDILLDGPDGFTLLDELISYEDTAKIPIVIVSSLNLTGRDLSVYGVRRILQKDTMTPADIRAAIQDFVTPNALAGAPLLREGSPNV